MSDTLRGSLLEGRPEPFGTHVRDGGVNVAVFSDHAERIELCLFDGAHEGAQELRRLPLHGPHDGVFHGFLPGAGPGLVYGLRAHGPYAPHDGHRFNPHKLLLDPWAREIVGQHQWRPEHQGFDADAPEATQSFNADDNAPWALKARVAAPLAGPAPGWFNAPRVPTSRRVLYELHVRGFTMQHPAVPPALRGTFAGLAHPAVVAHFQALGVTTLSLLPVFYALDEPALATRGQRNHWGYNTLGFFCPNPRYAMSPGDPAAVAEEFRQMVDVLHQAGLEVVLDVVHNHTPEGGEDGATLSWRGLDQASWYRLAPDDRSRCENLTGCGNTLRVDHPRVTQFVLDSLRHWVHDMGVDGFRFDLATVLGRTDHGFDPHAAFFTALRQDPVLARAHLIAEPWDAAYGGYQVGRFPGRFLEWNDKFRDGVRRYWLGLGTRRGEFARRFAGSSDLFHHGHRRPSASVNFVTAHDGFTLADLTAYSRKHNQANGEGNRDGRDGEPAANFGVEGPTTDVAVLDTRRRVRRAILATLIFAQGTPMLASGDELGRSQGGNNNAYNQDNPTGWVDWDAVDEDLRGFTARCLALRRAEPALRHDRWALHTPREAGDLAIVWLAPDGHVLSDADWQDPRAHAFAGRITSLGDDMDADGTDPHAAHWLVVFNPDPTPTAFDLPDGPWTLVLDSSEACTPGPLGDDHAALTAPPRSLLLLRADGGAGLA